MSIKYPPHKSSIKDTDAHYIAMIAYISVIIASLFPYLNYFAWLVPLVIFLIEKNSGLVKHHSMQAFTMGLVITALNLILYATKVWAAMYSSVLGTILYVFLVIPLTAALIAAEIIFFFFTVKSIIAAYQYQEYSIPVITKIADKITQIFGKKH